MRRYIRRESININRKEATAREETTNKKAVNHVNQQVPGKGRNTKENHHRKVEEDDGRTVADMSMIGRPGIGQWRGSSHSEGISTGNALPGNSPSGVRHLNRGNNPGHPGRSDRPWEEAGMTREEKRATMAGAIGAGLLIAGIFIAAFGIVILLMIYLWT